MGDFWGDFWERCYQLRHGYPSRSVRADIERFSAFIDDLIDQAKPETNLNMIRFLLDDLNMEVLDHQLRQDRSLRALRGTGQLQELLAQLSHSLPGDSDCLLTFYDALLENVCHAVKPIPLETNYGSVRGHIPTIKGLDGIANQAAEFIREAFQEQAKPVGRSCVEWQNTAHWQFYQDRSDTGSSGTTEASNKRPLIRLSSRLVKLHDQLRDRRNNIYTANHDGSSRTPGEGGTLASLPVEADDIDFFEGKSFHPLSEFDQVSPLSLHDDNLPYAHGTERTRYHSDVQSNDFNPEEDGFANDSELRNVSVRYSLDGQISRTSDPEYCKDPEPAESLEVPEAEYDSDSTQNFSWATSLSVEFLSDEDSDMVCLDDLFNLLFTPQALALRDRKGTASSGSLRSNHLRNRNHQRSQTSAFPDDLIREFSRESHATDNARHPWSTHIEYASAVASPTSSKGFDFQKQPVHKFVDPWYEDCLKRAYFAAQTSYSEGYPNQNDHIVNQVLVARTPDAPEGLPYELYLELSQNLDSALKLRFSRFSDFYKEYESELDRESAVLLERGHTEKLAEDTANRRYYRLMQRHESEMFEIARGIYLPGDIYRHENPFEALSIHGDPSQMEYAPPFSWSEDEEFPTPTRAHQDNGSHLRGGATRRVVKFPSLADERIPVFSHIREALPLFWPYFEAKWPGAVLSCLSRFINSRGNEYFCDIDEEYLTDRFNLTSLNTEVQHYQYALDLITDVLDIDVDDDTREQIEKSARHLYGLVHARYIVTTRGLQKMCEKYKTGDFGKCPRVACDGQPLLPMGQHDTAHMSAVKLYCARCEDLYNPKSSRHASIDGAYFGSSFHNMFFQVYQNLMPPKSQRRYEPKIFGFRVHGPATLARWQTAKREEVKETLKSEGLETGFEEEEREEEMEVSDNEEDTGQDGIDDMFEGRRAGF